MYLSDDPALDFARYDAEQVRRLEKLPTCQLCGDAIQQERAFCKDGFWICDECLENNRMEVMLD